MTDNISRLYRLNNIDKVFYVSDNVFEDGYDLNSIKEDYPPFTDTKQLELIKWISLNVRYMWNYIGQTVKDTWVLAIDYTQIFKFKSCEHTDFSQALAGLVCELWEDLTDEQREEVRGILQ